jgi:2-oxoglutarate dehydrogenase E2 component (dihydrolipoamide succinyltransferase)
MSLHPPVTHVRAALGAGIYFPVAGPASYQTFRHGRMIEIKVPPLGESIVEATISRWLKNPGDSVGQGEPLVELETDKVTVEVPAFKAGVLASRTKNEGDIVKVDEVLGELDDSAAGAATQAAPAAAAPSESVTPAPAERAQPAPRAEAPVAAREETRQAGEAVRSAPAARRAAADEGISLADVQGTARGGVVTKQDVMAHAGGAGATAQQAPEAGVPTAGGDRLATARGASSAAPAAAAGGPPPTGQSTTAPSARPQPSVAPAITSPQRDGARETREKMSTRRRRIAEHLLEAQHATAHLTTFNEVDMSAVMTLRERLKEPVEKQHGVKLTYMPFFARAASMALKAYPVVNAQIEDDSIVYRHYVNMGIAVASDQGLVVPVVKDADAIGMVEFTRRLTDVAKRARDGKLTMDDLTGGTFTITNGGVFGSLVSTPILNYPQVAILGLHKIQDRPVAIDGKVEIRPMMYLALSYDHRIVDGQQAVLFLVRIKELLEEPGSMLVD